MNNEIKIYEEYPQRIIIESPQESGDRIVSLLLKENYSLIDFIPSGIGRSKNNAFNINDAEMKYFSIMKLAQTINTDVEIIANLLNKEFGGYLHKFNDYYLVSDNPGC